NGNAEFCSRNSRAFPNRSSARAAPPPACAKDSAQSRGLARSRAIHASRAKSSTHSFFSSMNPRSASRATDSSARFAPRAFHAASATIPYIDPHSCRASPPPIAKPANLQALPTSSGPRLIARSPNGSSSTRWSRYRTNACLATIATLTTSSPQPQKWLPERLSSPQPTWGNRASMSPLYAGAARVELEPPVGLAMLGYGNRAGRNAGVHVLALGNRIAGDVRERVAADTGIPADSILICATHTHSAPAFNIFATPRAAAIPADGRDLAWERALPAKIASAIVQAHKNLEPATLRAATARFTLGINRRLMRPNRQIQLAANDAGPADAEVMALGAYRADGSPIAFLMNYPCHGVVLCEDNLLYSRDWPGFAMDEIECAAASGAGPRPISIFLQGATGNIDPRSRGSFEVAEQYGRAMGR